MEINKSNYCYTDPTKLFIQNVKNRLDELYKTNMTVRRKNLVVLLRTELIRWTIEQDEVSRFCVTVSWDGSRGTLDNFATDELAEGRLSIADIKFITATIADGVGLGKNLEQSFDFEDDVIIKTMLSENGGHNGRVVASFYFN